MAKLKRSAIMHFVSVDGEKTWYLIGAHVEDLSVDMKGTFETSRDITDGISVTDNGYEPTFEVTPYYAKRGDGLFAWLQSIMMNRSTGSDCAAKYLEIIVSDKTVAEHNAWMEDCMIEVGQYGGSKSGFRINYTVHPAGGRTYGKAALISGKQPVYLDGNNSAVVGLAVVGRAIVGASAT